MSITTLHKDDSGVHLVTIDNVLFAALHRPLRHADLESLSEGYRRNAALGDRPYLHLIDPVGDTNYDRAVTNAYLTILDNYWDSWSVISIAMVANNRFMGSIVRSMATSFLLRRAKKPLHVHDSVPSACSWLTQQENLQVDLSLESLEAFLASSRASALDAIQ